MKKIVKCILPIVSSAALVTPVLVSCGQTYKALPDDYYEYQGPDNQYLKCIKGKDKIPNFNGFNTIKIPKSVKMINAGALTESEDDNRFDVIKYLDFNNGGKLEIIEAPAVSNLKKLEKIIFCKEVTSFDNNTFNVLPSLKVIDLSCYDEYPVYLSSNDFGEDIGGEEKGIIYVKKPELVETAEYNLVTSGTSLQGWTVKVKQK